MSNYGILDELIQYSNDVLDGKIIACQKHKWACQRFLDDLERQGTDDFPYIFDEEEAYKFLYWMTLFKHKKGILQGQHINPHIIQRFVFGNIYGWRHKDTGFRRFKYLYWQIARKNAKSQSLALVGLYELMAMGENGAEVLCAATKTKQSKIVWNEAKWMLENCPDLKGKYKIANSEITHLKTDSKMVALSKEDGKTGDGTHPSCGIVDEYHLHKTTEMYDVIESGMLGRNQPLLAIITTAGRDLSNPAYRVEYNYVSNVLNPHNPIENDKYFVMINELDENDDINDKRNWEKANPIICSTEQGWQDLEDKYVKALAEEEKMIEFKIKNLNIWLNAKENGYIDMQKWDKCIVKELPDLTGKEVYIGVDLSATLDLTSVAFLIPLDDGKFAVKSHSFIPESKLKDRINSDKMPFDYWVNKNWITEIPGETIDDRDVIEYIKKEVEANDWVVKEIAYDDWNARQFGILMSEEGFNMTKIPQNISQLNEPTKKFRTLVYQNKIVTEKNDVLTWAIGNAVAKSDHSERIVLDKTKSTERIDPIAAVINAYARAMFHFNSSVDLNEMITDEKLEEWGW